MNLNHQPASLPPELWLAGRMGSGKSTIARVLARERGAVILPLAYAVKLDVALYYGLSVEEINMQKDAFRAILQDHGHGFRELIPSIWLNRWTIQHASLTLLSQRTRRDMYVVVDDCRYINEAAFAVERGAPVVRIVVPDEVRIARLTALYGRAPAPDELYHPSETEVDDLTAHFDFPGDLPEDQIASALMTRIEEWRLAPV